MRPYPAYKDSGIEWLGEVPEDWTYTRLRFCVKLNPSKQEIRHLPKDTELSFIPMEAVGEDGSLDLSTTRTIDDVIDGYTFFRNDDVAIAKITPCFENGKGCMFRNLHNNYGFGTTELTVMRPQCLAPEFLYYLTISHRFRNTGIGLMQGSAGQKRVPDNFIKDYVIGLPSEAEQQSIVSFLNRETARIDALIRKKERMIELLKEKRIALITQAVTKGLDHKVKMKDSGIEWLGEVPEHWEVKRLKYIAKIQTGYTPPKSDEDNYEEEGILWVKPDDLNEFFYIEDSTERVSEKGIIKGRLVKPFSALVCCIGSIGKFGVSKHTIITNQQINSITFDNQMHKMYGLYAVSVSSQEHLRLANRNVVSILNSETQKKISFAVPQESEQQAIASYLDCQTGKIDTIIHKQEHSISLLHEYRASLIHHAVTGKIDLRGNYVST